MNQKTLLHLLRYQFSCIILFYSLFKKLYFIVRVINFHSMYVFLIHWIKNCTSLSALSGFKQWRTALISRSTLVWNFIKIRACFTVVATSFVHCKKRESIIAFVESLQMLISVLCDHQPNLQINRVQIKSNYSFISNQKWIFDIGSTYSYKQFYYNDSLIYEH